MQILGVDVGGSGIKAARVDTELGRFVGDRKRIATPQPATPSAVAGTVRELIDHFEWTGAVGVGFPAVVREGVVHTASNIDSSWIGTDAASLLSGSGHGPVTVLNDADAAGLAEMRHGAGRGVEGKVLMVTLGTGIGTALFSEGRLVTNTELGHIEVAGKIAEDWAADSVREKKDLSWERWGKRVGKVLRKLDALLWPDRIVLGGGVSKRSDRFLPYVDVRCEVVVAELRNRAGIIGAAMAAAERNR